MATADYSAMKNLTSLTIYPRQKIEKIKSLPQNIQYLWIPSTFVKATDLEAICNCTSLTALHVRDLETTQLQSLSKLVNLEYLGINCVRPGTRYFSFIVPYFIRLQLHIIFCYVIFLFYLSWRGVNLVHADQLQLYLPKLQFLSSSNLHIEDIHGICKFTQLCSFRYAATMEDPAQVKKEFLKYAPPFPVISTKEERTE